MNQLQRKLILDEIWRKEKYILEKRLLIHELKGKNPNSCWVIHYKIVGTTKEQIGKESGYLYDLERELVILKEGINNQEISQVPCGAKQATGLAPDQISTNNGCGRTIGYLGDLTIPCNSVHLCDDCKSTKNEVNSQRLDQRTMEAQSVKVQNDTNGNGVATIFPSDNIHFQIKKEIDKDYEEAKKKVVIYDEGDLDALEKYR